MEGEIIGSTGKKPVPKDIITASIVIAAALLAGGLNVMVTNALTTTETLSSIVRPDGTFERKAPLPNDISALSEQGIKAHKEFKDDIVTSNKIDAKTHDGHHYDSYEVTDSNNQYWFIEYKDNYLNYAHTFLEDGTEVIWNYYPAGTKNSEFSRKGNIETGIKYTGAAGEEHPDAYYKIKYWNNLKFKLLENRRHKKYLYCIL